MNSQRKQQGRAGIKTDKYGVPLNYGNYKNGRLVTKKGGKGGGKGGKGGGKGGGNNGGGGGGGGRGGGAAPNSRAASLLNGGGQNQNKNNGKNNNNGQGGGNQGGNSKGRDKSKDEGHAHVGLTGEAHGVIREALLRNTVVYSSSDSDDGECGSGGGGRARGRGDALPQKKKGRRRTGNVPDLQPPPRIKIAPVRPAKGGEARMKAARSVETVIVDE